MGQANCCYQKVDKDLFVESALQQDKFRVIQGESLNQKVNPALQQFRYDDGFSRLQEKHGSQRWYKHQEKEEYYLGDWENGEMKGIGILYVPDKFAYFGDFYRTPNGRGKLVNYQHNITYTGDIQRGSVQGNGKVTHNQGLYQFQGKLQEGRPVQGNLVVYNPENNSLKFKAEIPDSSQPRAKISYSDKKFYDGLVNTRSFLPEGQGRMQYPNGNVYDGEWKNGQFHGRGKFSWKDESYYEGQYCDGAKHGQGKFVYPSGKYYQGNWQQGRQHGEGKMYNESNDIIKEGSWQNGRHHQT